MRTAHALATPIRQCNITKARLPAHFLQSFSTVIAAAPTPSPVNEQQEEEVTSAASLSTSSKSRLLPTLLPSPSPTTSLPQPISTGTSSYVLNRRDMLSHLTRRDRWSAIVTPRMQDAYAKLAGKKRVKVEKEWRWDEDMPDLVLSKLRGEVVERLKWCLADEQRKLLVPVAEIEDKVVAAVLEVRPGVEGEGERMSVPPVHAVYNLPELLGDEAFSQLLLPETLKESTQLAILQHPRTVKLLLALDILRAYILPRDAQPVQQRKRVGDVAYQLTS